MKRRNRMVSALTALCLCVCLGAVPARAAGEDLKGKTAVLVTGNIRGDIGVYARVAALKESYERRGADVVLADAGNFLQGSVYASTDFGASIFALMDLAGYDVAGLGSYDFAWSRPETGSEGHGDWKRWDDLFALAEKASFPVISASVRRGGEAAFAPSAVVTAENGHTVGFVALTAQPAGMPFPADSVFGDVTVLDAAEALGEARKAAEALDADWTVCLSSLGRDAVRGMEELDVFDSVADTADAAPGAVSVTLLDGTGKAEHEEILDLTEEAYAPGENAVSARVAELTAAYESAPSARSEVLLPGADHAARKGETALGDLWADALRWFALEGNIGASYDEDDIAMGNTGLAADAAHTVALWNGGNLRADLPAGLVTDTELAAVLPYPNRVAVIYLTGAQLTEALEAASQGLPYTQGTADACSSLMQVSGLRYTVDLGVPYARGEAYGEHWFRAASLGRVTVEDVNGVPLDPAATYAVITSNANFNGMDSSYIFQEAAQADARSTITTANVRDVVWRYIREELGGVIGEPYTAAQGRITLSGTPAPAFQDVPAGIWYEAAVREMAASGVMRGTGEGKFSPDASLTRAMALQLLYNLAGSPAVQAQGGSWYAAARTWAMNTGISDGERMEDAVTRQEMAVLLHRFRGNPHTDGTLSAFPDGGSVSSWAAEGMAWAAEQGIFQGGAGGRLAPRDTATRAQAAVLLQRYLAL